MLKFKIDENLPIEIATLLHKSGYDAMTVKQQNLSGTKDPTLLKICQQEQRILVTLDLDFSDIRTYSPQSTLGIIVLRVKRQDKPYIISIFQKVITLLQQESVTQQLWIVEEDKIRIRG